MIVVGIKNSVNLKKQEVYLSLKQGEKGLFRV